jgi:hypothetical protein
MGMTKGRPAHEKVAVQLKMRATGKQVDAPKHDLYWLSDRAH